MFKVGVLEIIIQDMDHIHIQLEVVVVVVVLQFLKLQVIREL